MDISPFFGKIFCFTLTTWGFGVFDQIFTLRAIQELVDFDANGQSA
jgi:hypothetical protein